MSFGGSASDIASLVKLAYKTTQGARAACGEYDELTRETSSLHTILNRLSLEVAKPDSSINRQKSYGRELESIGTGCQEVLTQLDKILVKYNALSEQERSARRLWKKIRFGSGVVADVAELRSRVTYYISALSLFLNLVSIGTVGAVEKKMDQAGGDLRDIKVAVNQITAYFLSTEHREGSVLTAYTDDDRDAWRELRRGLVKAGFRDSLVRTHMDTIMAYVKELGDRGVLDNIDVDEVDSPTSSTRASDNLEGSSNKSQDTEPSPTAASDVAEYGPITVGEDHKERPLQAEDLNRDSHLTKLVDRRQFSKVPAGSPRCAISCLILPIVVKKADFLKHDNIRYYSSISLLPTSNFDVIFLDELKLPHFIADTTVIYNTNAPIGSDDLRLDQLLISIRYRLISLTDTMGFVRSRWWSNNSEDYEWMKNRYLMKEQLVSLLLCFRFPDVAGVMDIDSIESLDFRRATTLCSVFAADFIRVGSNPVQDSVVDLRDLTTRILDWQVSFDKSLPNNNDQLQQHYGPSLLYLLTQQPGIALRVRNAKKLLKELPAPEELRWYHYPRLFADVTRYPPWLPPAAWETPRLRSERTANG